MESKSERMHRLYDQWSVSGLSRKDFCKEARINYATFNYWYKRFSVKADTGFRELVVSKDAEICMELVFPSGAKLLFHSTPPVSWLHELLV